MPEQPPDYYDRIFATSAAYRGDGARWAPLWDWTVRQLVDHAPCGSVVLDVGCGPGHLAARLAGVGYRVVGTDFSAVALDQARERVPGGVFVRGTLPECLPELLRAHRPAAVTCCELLEHLACDLDVIAAVRDAGVPLVATLPDFPDAGHVRHYPTADHVTARYHVTPEPIGAHHWGITLQPSQITTTV